MKRFLLIFAICLSAVVGVVAGIYGIKYLKGDFDPVVITPENIRFDLGNETEYNVCDNFTAKIISDTEGVTVDEVELDFVIDTSVGESVKIPYKKLKDKIQYSAVTIPKTVKIGEEFEIIVNKSYNEELGEDWIVGGNVTISATAVSNTAVYKTVDINVDVPVKSAELVVVSGFNEISESTNFSSLMKNIESSEIAKPLSEIADDNSPFVYAGDEFYLGVKYSPAESAFKYSKISSTNLFIEYETEIKEQAKNYGLEAEVNALLDYVNSGTNVQATYLFELYEKVISENINNTQFVNYIKSLNEKFTSNLKYITIENEILNEISYVNKFDRVYGTNLFKYNATNNTEGWDKSVNSKLYAYITTDAKSEEKFFEDFNSSDEVRLRELEKDSKRETPIYNIKKINSEVKVVDVEIDAINILGSVQSFKTHQIYNLFALKDGTNNEYNSYLKLDLSNDNIDIDLSKKVQNVAITFEMKTGTNTWSYAKDIQVIDAQQVNVAGTENIYYKPTINGSDYKNAYWKIYSDVYITNEVRTKVVYLNNDETINNNIVIDEKTYPSFNLEDATLTEENVSWNDISNLDIGTLHLTGVMNETDGKVVVKKEIDLSKLVNVPKANNFQQYKFFLYTKDEVDLNNYFYLKDKESKTYLIDGEYFKLFELDGENLKLKNDDISNLTSDVYVMFATVKTSALGYAITTNGLYEFIKYSIALDGGNNVLSSLKLQFNKYISGIEGVIFNVTCEDENSAGIIESVSGEELKLAQNKTDIAKISLSLHPTANDATKENFKQILDAMLKEKITLVAYNANTQELIEIINANPFVSGENAYFVISTKEVIQDANIFFAIKYIVWEKCILF